MMSVGSYDGAFLLVKMRLCWYDLMHDRALGGRRGWDVGRHCISRGYGWIKRGVDAGSGFVGDIGMFLSFFLLHFARSFSFSLSSFLAALFRLFVFLSLFLNSFLWVIFVSNLVL